MSFPSLAVDLTTEKKNISEKTKISQRKKQVRAIAHISTHKHLSFVSFFLSFFFCFLITRVTGIVGQKVWAFVYTQIGPHTVSRPVFVIQPRLVCVYVCVSICYI